MADKQLFGNKQTIKTCKYHQFVMSKFLGPNSPDTPNLYTPKMTNKKSSIFTTTEPTLCHYEPT